MRDWWFPALLGLGVACFLALMTAVIYNEVKHPCIRSYSYACTRRICTFRTGQVGKVPGGTCLSWREEPDTCTQCLERKP